MIPLFTIYIITNKINNKKYIGQTTLTIKERFTRHCWRSTFLKDNQIIPKAIEKYGKENFQIFEIDYADSLEEANRKEVYWGIFYNSLSPNGYNLKLGGRKYAAMAQETKDKIGKAHKGRKASPETIKRLSESHMGFKVSDETREKMSKINKGKKPHKNTNIAASLKTSKKYLLLSPEGVETEIINMRQFCLTNDLSITRMSNLVNGKVETYKGWKFLKNLGRMNEQLGSRRKPLRYE